MHSKIDLFSLTSNQLEGYLQMRDASPRHANTIMDWIYRRGHHDYQGLTTLSPQLRNELTNSVSITSLPVYASERDNDGVVKWQFTVQGGVIETVFIPSRGRGTLCISSQVGCALNCAFCATATLGWRHNLSAAEIIGQVWTARQLLKEAGNPTPITNVVFMGMGEPLLNFGAVATAIRILIHPFAFAIPRRRVTVSTAGVVPGIHLLRPPLDVSLMLSLHSARDAVRNTLVPLNKKYPIATLLDACQRYLKENSTRWITIAYTLIEGINDSIEEARQLLTLLNTTTFKINLIPLNTFSGSPFRTPSTLRIDRFRTELCRAGYRVTVRTPRGNSIDAACGQLIGTNTQRNKHIIACT